MVGTYLSRYIYALIMQWRIDRRALDWLTYWLLFANIARCHEKLRCRSICIKAHIHIYICTYVEINRLTTSLLYLFICRLIVAICIYYLFTQSYHLCILCSYKVHSNLNFCYGSGFEAKNSSIIVHIKLCMGFNVFFRNLAKTRQICLSKLL